MQLLDRDNCGCWHLPTVVYYNLNLLEKMGARVPPIDWGDTSWATDAMVGSAVAAAKDMDDPTAVQYGMLFGAGQLGVFEWLWGADPFNNVGGPSRPKLIRTESLPKPSTTQKP